MRCRREGSFETLRNLDACIAFASIKACMPFLSLSSFLPPSVCLSLSLSQDVDLDKECVYMLGNSLGLQPKGAKAMVDNELEKWRRK